VHKLCQIIIGPYMVSSTWHIAHMRKARNTCNILSARREEKKIFASSKRRLEDNIKMDLKGMGFECVD